MTANSLLRLLPLAALLLGACASPPRRAASDPADPPPPMHAPTHHADLLFAGLDVAALRAPTPPPFADARAPTAEELRRRALWTNWRGIADLAPGGGYGELYGTLAAVAGREFHGLRRVDGARHPHRVLLQLPDAFDTTRRCLLVTASSGSRGIYGAIALAGAWGLPRGCAVAYTDKGAGTDFADASAPQRHALDGTRIAPTDQGAFAPAFDTGVPPGTLAYKHAHSGDNPEADWGRHLRQAAEFGLQALTHAYPDQPAHTFDDTLVIAVGLSNGGGAVLRAAELEGDWLDGAVAVAPNVWPGAGGRALFDYVSEAALQPCALLDPRFDGVALARPGGAASPAAALRCNVLRDAGVLQGEDTAALARDALRRLHAAGWNDAALEAGALSVAFDLWRAIAAGYASAYSRSSAATMPCSYRYGALDAAGQPRAFTDEERAAWWSDSSGIPPGTGIALLDAQAHGADPALPALRCLRALWDGRDPALVAGVDATRAGLPRPGLPLIVVHGADDGLVPEAFSGGAYARWAKAQGRATSYWQVANAQHFDSFLALPPLATRYVPLLPYAYRALDAMWAHLVDDLPLPADARIEATPRAFVDGALEPLRAAHLKLP